MTRQRVGLLLVAGLVIAVATLAGLRWWSLGVPVVAAFDPGDYVVFALAAILGERLVLPRQRGRATSMSVAVVGATILLGHSPAMAAGLAAVAWLSQMVVAMALGRSRRVGSLFAGTLAAWGLTGVIGVAAAVDPFRFEWLHTDVSVLAILAWWVLLVFGTPAVEAFEMALRADRSRRLTYRDLVRSGWQSETVLAATATLGALAYPSLQRPTVLLMALPLLAAKVGLERYNDIRRNYDQTLRAMSRLPEQLGAVDPGHGVRVGELAALAAVELGYNADVVADIERAAQLHELGRIRGEHGIELSPSEVAVAGASIVTEAGGLDRVAQLIAAHRGPVPIGNDLAWVGGAIIRLACDLDLRIRSRPEPYVEPSDEAWLREQGVELRIASALIRSVRSHLAATAA